MVKKFVGRINNKFYLSLVGNPTVNVTYNKQVSLEEYSQGKRKDELVEEIINDSDLQEKVKECNRLNVDYIISIIEPRDTKTLEKFMINKGLKKIKILDTEKKDIDIIQEKAHLTLEAQNRRTFHDFRITDLEKWHEMSIDLYKQNKKLIK